MAVPLLLRVRLVEPQMVPQPVGDGAALRQRDALLARVVVLEQLVARGGPPLGAGADVERRHPVLRRPDAVAIAIVDEGGGKS
jgi:hypothetical protein